MIQKKKILILAPIMTSSEELTLFLSMLAFLEPNYTLHGLDPLLECCNLDNDLYYQKWYDKLSSIVNQYDAFIGFSFGGVILQQCFWLFFEKNLTKPIILFSVPSFADQPLIAKLSQVLILAEARQFGLANQLMLKYVLHPNVLVEPEPLRHNNESGCVRLIEGIKRILSTDSCMILKKYPVSYHHFIGENSYLVNQNNVITGAAGNLMLVPNASMRVLKDNSTYCYKKIEEILL